MMKYIFLCILSTLLGAFAHNPNYIAGTTPPYLVYLKSEYLPCAGVLIHPLWVVTAAHCNLPRLQVFLGVTNPSDSTEENVEVNDYEKMIHHPHFSIASISYDLMLIKLRRMVKPSNHVKIVKLPQHIVPINSVCSVSTWAYNLCDTSELKALSAKDPDSLQTVNISVISKDECRNAYKAYDIKDNMLCVGIVAGRRLPCKEVSAAPAVCNGVLYGILTYADGCILRADIGIYASIFHYLPWIEDTIRNN